MAKKIHVNGKLVTVSADDATPLLWVLREHLELTGTKFGCGIAQCGACTVHLDGQPVRSCVYPLSAITENQKITTIEGLSEDTNHPIQQAWAALDTPQCGYCQSGMIMACAALLDSNPNPSDDDINSTITNICRCGTFQRVREGIHLAAEIKAGKKVAKEMNSEQTETTNAVEFFDPNAASEQSSNALYTEVKA
ncbi:(2Fe-2S)-binding protein [Marinibactrum halimedae]|uniref:(2Fe-2S)-binding protein n=1 Tax=Marinibactrum halimedae TaxID=1444977 RepID=A0AA37TAY5_9GAMM|nr:(2Fe-2S)-binding protein [Marinibactrum halimedae]MCD9460975.1 (2Fe-2S)-binding protein [Marinibactrum halimedae]GLS28082.1 (2Fe-2S)-binding protein [Marinibactrum halimedae]